MVKYSSLKRVKRLKNPFYKTPPFAQNISIERNVSTLSQHSLRDFYVTTSGSPVSTGVETMVSAYSQAFDLASPYGLTISGKRADRYQQGAEQPCFGISLVL
jgi:hypothetical protein